MPPARDKLLSSRLRDLAELWMYVRCEPPCTKVVCLPLKKLARQRGGLTLGEALSKLKCTACGRLPAQARVVDYPIEGEQHELGPRVATWSVTVVP